MNYWKRIDGRDRERKPYNLTHCIFSYHQDVPWSLVPALRLQLSSSQQPPSHIIGCFQFKIHSLNCFGCGRLIPPNGMNMPGSVWQFFGKGSSRSPRVETSRSDISTSSKGEWLWLSSQPHLGRHLPFWVVPLNAGVFSRDSQSRFRSGFTAIVRLTLHPFCSIQNTWTLSRSLH